MLPPPSSPSSSLLLPRQVVEDDAVTGRQFHEKVTAATQLLKWKGVAPNDSVLITLQPSVDFYAIAIAALAIGMFYTPIVLPSLLLPSIASCLSPCLSSSSPLPFPLLLLPSTASYTSLLLLSSFLIPALLLPPSPLIFHHLLPPSSPFHCLLHLTFYCKPPLYTRCRHYHH